MGMIGFRFLPLVLNTLSWALEDGNLKTNKELVLAGPVEAKRINTLLIFGDELSDEGNLFRITNGKQPNSSEFYRGRFSDGPVWVEYLRNLTGVRYYGNFAVGGATANNLTQYQLKSAYSSYFSRQISNFKKWKLLHPSYNPDEAQAIVVLGKNDYQVVPSITDSQVVMAIQNGVESLVKEHHIKRFLLAEPMSPNHNQASLFSKMSRLAKNLQAEFASEKINVTLWDVQARIVDDLIFNDKQGLVVTTMEKLIGPQWRDDVGNCMVDLVSGQPDLIDNFNCTKVIDKLSIQRTYYRTPLHEGLAKLALEALGKSNFKSTALN